MYRGRRDDHDESITAGYLALTPLLSSRCSFPLLAVANLMRHAQGCILDTMRISGGGPLSAHRRYANCTFSHFDYLTA